MKRNQKYIRDRITVKGSEIITQEKCIIEFPDWYLDKNLAIFGETSKVYGVFAIIMGDNYTTSIIPTLLDIRPIMIKKIKREDGDYTQLFFNKGDTIVQNTKVVMKDVLGYSLFESFYMYAKVPWFINYEDGVRILDNMPKYGGSGVGVNNIANELMISFLTRLKTNKNQFHRLHLDKEYTFIDLMDVFYGVKTVTNKIAGNYFKDSLTSALVQDEKQTSKLEQHAWE